MKSGYLIFRLFIFFSYSRNATKMARMLRARPTNSEEMVVKWTEFLAKFLFSGQLASLCLPEQVRS